MIEVYEYRCSEGHWQQHPKDDMRKCPVYKHGSPCKGVMKRIGKGSRKKEAETSE